MDEVTPGWQVLAVVAEGTRVDVGGRNVWGATWVPTEALPVVLAHPAHPSQRHTMRVYHLEGAPAVLFACGELSANVWGFFIQSPALPA
jgi:hypothetical protein